VDSAPATRRHGVNFQSLWGILVTTSGFGKAPFDFANDKPLELLSGTNLLYLLKEHAPGGCPVRRWTWVGPR
jgi:restriction endonuclease Mrr